MPRRVINRGIVSTDHPKLVSRLVEELKKSAGDGPYILEEVHVPIDSRHVHVIWDKWRGIREEERSKIIYEAYADLEGEDATSNITIASGITPRDALALGMLPYVVRPTKDNGRHTRAGHQEIIDDEAKNTLLGSGEELRYPTLEDAEAARRRLEQHMPDASWCVVQEVD